jgi:hypothetical protein
MSANAPAPPLGQAVVPAARVPQAVATTPATVAATGKAGGPAGQLGNGATVAAARREPAKVPFVLTNHPFETAKARLGSIEVRLEGRVTVSASATLAGELPPASVAADKLPGWVSARVSQLVVGALAAKPTGDARNIHAKICGEPLTLTLKSDPAGLEPFAVFAQFGAKGADVTIEAPAPAGARAAPGSAAGATAPTGAATLSSVKITLFVTAWIEPDRLKPAAPAAAAGAAPAKPAPAAVAQRAGDATIDTFTFAGSTAIFAGGGQRTGSVSQQDALEAIHRLAYRPAVFDPRNSHEDRLAFLQEMRHYFGSDAATVKHFERIRPVHLVGTYEKSKDSALIAHEEVALRIEAVQKELRARGLSMPTTTTGWSLRSKGASIRAAQDIGNLHNIGFAVDWDPVEAPHLEQDKSVRTLVELVTGKQPHVHASDQSHTTGSYHDQMRKGEALKQKDPMADLKPDDPLAPMLANVRQAAEEAHQRSEVFRRSLDTKDGAATISAVKELLALRDSYFGTGDKTRAWGDPQRAALTKLLAPWSALVEAKYADEVRAAGFSFPLPASKAIPTEEQALTDAVADATSELAKVKGPPPYRGAQSAALRRCAATLRRIMGAAGTPRPVESRPLRRPLVEPASVSYAPLAELRQSLGRPDSFTLTSPAGAPHPALGTAPLLEALDDSTLVPALIALKVTAQRRLLGYPSAFTLSSLRELLADPVRVFGKTKAMKDTEDPSLAQMMAYGYFSLGKDATFKDRVIHLDFIEAMIRHGFHHLGQSAGAPDFMHFELRWSGPGKPGAAPETLPVPPAATAGRTPGT